MGKKRITKTYRSLRSCVGNGIGKRAYKGGFIELTKAEAMKAGGSVELVDPQPKKAQAPKQRGES